MSGNFFSVILDVVIMGYGCYAVWLYTDMKRTGKLRQNLMLPRQLPANRCRDVAGYIAFMGRKILLFGAATMICGLLAFLQDLTYSDNLFLAFAPILVFLGLCYWYAKESKIAVKKFW